MLHLHVDATEDYSEFYQETLENLVIRAENVCTIVPPEEPMPSVRHGACVRLLDVSQTWGADDERASFKEILPNISCNQIVMLVEKAYVGVTAGAGTRRRGSVDSGLPVTCRHNPGSAVLWSQPTDFASS